MITDNEYFLVERFLPRVFVTKTEPFRFNDLVVVIHPDKTRRLIGYHLIWEDDIDYLTDKDPSDHEIVWIKFSENLKIEMAWSCWHRKILTTTKAVSDANANNFRVKVNVQWGTHGPLLEGWEEKIGINEPIGQNQYLEPIAYARLHKARAFSEGFYPDRWPQRFEGTLDDFITFPVEVDIKVRLKRNICIVNQNAYEMVRQHVPYEISLKPDWPLLA